jgi:hypothetical protein
MSKRILWWLGALGFGGVVILVNSNSAQWVFLARVQWSALLALTILPVLAHTFGRELLIGGYDLNNRLAGFHVGLLLSTMSAFAGILPAWLRSGYFRVDGTSGGSNRVTSVLQSVFWLPQYCISG